MTRSDHPISAVAFDLDGLMFNTEAIYIDVATELLGRRGHPLDMLLIQQMMGRPAKTALPIMIEWYGLDDDVETLERETREIFDEILPRALKPLPGLLELIRAIDDAQIPKAIATSSRLRYLKLILQLAQLPTQFEFFLTAEDVEHGKPHPEIYLLAARRFGVPPGNMLVLEDSQHGSQAAVAAGAVTVAVPGEHNDHADYAHVDLQVDALNDARVLARIPN